jgi:hypothetical protein
MLSTAQIRHAVDSGNTIDAGFLDLKNSVVDAAGFLDLKTSQVARASFFAGVVWMLRLLSVCPQMGIAPHTLLDRLTLEIRRAFPELPTKN